MTKAEMKRQAKLRVIAIRNRDNAKNSVKSTIMAQPGYSWSNSGAYHGFETKYNSTKPVTAQ